MIEMLNLLMNFVIIKIGYDVFYKDIRYYYHVYYNRDLRSAGNKTLDGYLKGIIKYD